MIRVLLLAAVLLAFDARPAYAYLDLGTLTIAVQYTVGGIVAGIAFLKVYGGRILQFFRGKREKTDLESSVLSRDSSDSG